MRKNNNAENEVSVNAESTGSVNAESEVSVNTENEVSVCSLSIDRSYRYFADLKSWAIIKIFLLDFVDFLYVERFFTKHRRFQAT